MINSREIQSELLKLKTNAGALLRPDLKKDNTFYMNRPQQVIFKEQELLSLLKKFGIVEPDFTMFIANPPIDPKVEVIIEGKVDGSFEGYVYKEDFVARPRGKTKAELIDNLKALIKKFQLFDGAEHKFWKNICVDILEIELSAEKTGLVSRKKF